MLGGISIWQLLIVLAIVVLIFGTRKLRNVGSDLGGFVRNFKTSMKEGESEPPPVTQKPHDEAQAGTSSTETKDKTG